MMAPVESPPLAAGAAAAVSEDAVDSAPPAAGAVTVTILPAALVLVCRTLVDDSEDEVDDDETSAELEGTAEELDELVEDEDAADDETALDEVDEEATEDELSALELATDTEDELDDATGVTRAWQGNQRKGVSMCACKAESDRSRTTGQDRSDSARSRASKLLQGSFRKDGRPAVVSPPCARTASCPPCPVPKKSEQMVESSVD